MHIFEEVLFFQATYNNKTEKQTMDSTYLVSVGMGEAGGRKGA